MLLGLAFSGGKDSLACWYMYRHKSPIVFWVNTGKAYPETLAIVDEVRREAVEFIEVKTDQAAQTDLHGIPSDIVPIDCTDIGMQLSTQKPVKVQGYLSCCYTNVMAPLNEAVHARGITHLVRGQRKDEAHKSTASSGDIVGGIEMIQPIEDWTSEQVLSFIRGVRGDVPNHYAIEHSSLDCYDCTAYLAHSKDRIAWTKEKHPKFYTEYAGKMMALKSALAPTLALLEQTHV